MSSRRSGGSSGRPMGKRAQAAAAAQLAAVAAAARLEQQEQQRLYFFKRSLERNDVEIAALQDLHSTIQTAKRQVLTHCSIMHYSGCSCHSTADTNDDNNKDEKDRSNSNKNKNIAEESDCLLLLDLGQGKIRLTADKEGLEDASNNDKNSDISLVATLSPQAYHWSLDFLLRLQLRRQLLNRLVRRLQRMAVVMDAVAAADESNKDDIKDSSNNRSDAAAAAALVTHPPAQPKYGDLCLHIDAQEIQEFAQHWARQERARKEMEASRECFYEKQFQMQQALMADGDAAMEEFPTLTKDEEEDAAAVEAVQSTSNNPAVETVSSSSPEKQLPVLPDPAAATTSSPVKLPDPAAATTSSPVKLPDPASTTSSPVKQEEASTTETSTGEKNDIAVATGGGETKIGPKKDEDGDVPMEDAAKGDEDAAKKTTTTTIPISKENAADQENPLSSKDTTTAKNDDVPMKDAAADGSDDKETSADKQDDKQPPPAEKEIAEDQKPPPPPLAVSSSTNAVAGTDNAAAMTETNQGNAAENADDDDEEEEEDTGIDYEAFREYMNAYEKIVDPTTGHVQYTLLAGDAQSSLSDPKKKTKKKNTKIPSLSAFANNIGIGAANPHRIMSLQEVQAEYERWSGALLARLPCQPTLADLGLENQVYNVKERRRRALLAAAEAKATADAAAAAAAAASSPRLSFVSPGKKLRNKHVEKEVDTKEDDDDDDDDDHDDDEKGEEEEALAAPSSAYPGKKLRNKDDDSKEYVFVEKEDAMEDVAGEDIEKDSTEQDDDAKKDVMQEETKKDPVEQEDAKKDIDATKKDEEDVEMAKSDHDNDRMDVDEKEAGEEPKEGAKDDTCNKDKKEAKGEQSKIDSADGEKETKKDTTVGPSSDKDEQENEEKIDSADEEEEEQTDDDDNEESQETKPDDEEEDDDDDSSSSKNDDMADDQPQGDKQKEEEDEAEEEPPVNLKKRPIILAAVPSFHDQDLKRVRLVHAELMSASIRAHASRRIKDSTQEYNTALQLSHEIFARQQHLQRQLHFFVTAKQKDMSKAQDQWGVDYAVAKAQWNKRRLEFEEKKLDRLMPYRKNANHRPNGTPFTKMYAQQPEPSKQCIASTVAEIVDSVEVMSTCQMQTEQFDEPFRLPPRRNSNSSVEDQNRNNQVEATMRQEIAKLGAQLRSTEEDRQRAWRRMMKTQGEFTAVMNNRSTDMSRYPSVPLPDLRQSSHQRIPLEAAAGAHMGIPSYVPVPTERHPVRRSPLAAGAASASAFGVGGSDSKYSIARVRERISSDGTVAPVTAPKRNKDGLYARPAGRTRKGMTWDAVRGLWIRADQQTTLVVPQPPPAPGAPPPAFYAMPPPPPQG